MNTKPGPICFVCRSNLNSSRLSLGTHQKLTEGQRTFLLLELLGFPKITETRKNETRLCRPCIGLVKKGLRLKNEIQKLEERLETEVRAVISGRFKHGAKGSQQPLVSLSKSKVEQPQKKMKSENDRISFPIKNELHPDSDPSFTEELMDPEDIKEEVDSSMEPDTEQTSERFHSTSDSPEENDYQCADEDRHRHTKINFEEPEKKEEKKKLKRSKKKKHFLSLGQQPDSFYPSDSDPEDDSDPDWEVTWKINLEKQLQQEKKNLKCSRMKKAQFLALKHEDSSGHSVSDPPKKDSDVNWSGISETVEDNEFLEEMYVPDTEQPAEFHFPSSDPLEENDHCDPMDESEQAEEINFELEKVEKKVSRKRKSLTVRPSYSSDTSDSDTPEEDSDADFEAMSDTDEENDFIEATPVPVSSENNAPMEAEVGSRDLKVKRSNTKNFKYDCPSPFCPKIKDYSYNDFAHHLRFHKRRPYRCKLCCEFISEDQTRWKDHLEKNHPEAGETPVEEIIIKDDIKSGNVFQSAVFKHGRFPTEEERGEHERNCRNCKKQRRRANWIRMTCAICQKVLRYVNEWRFHRVLEHPEEDWMRCPFCDESFKEKTLQGIEERNDEKLFEHVNTIHRSENDVGKQLKLYDNCVACGLLFNGPMETVEHFQEKHGFIGALNDWTYPCRMCGKQLGNAYRLRRHMTNVHFRPEGSVCDLCGAKFAIQRTLIEHKFSQHHVNEDNLPRISCPEQGCEFNCFFKDTLRSHCEQHKPKNKICEICGRGFKRGPDLNRHRATHSTSVNN